MHRFCVVPLGAILGTLLLCSAAAAREAADFQPDPRTVQRYGPAYRYPQAGWIVLHIEGEPYERGCQHGRLLAPEIAAHVRCFSAVLSPKAPAEGWKLTRTLVNSLFLRRYEKEYLEEMKGIADGASAAGAKFEGRPIDLLDVVAINSWPEIDTLDSALEATATGLEGIRFPQDTPRPKPMPKPMRCSAFAANGKATRDGKIVFGHITMFGLYPSSFYNVWIDVKPAKGHRVLMQSYPAGIQSGLDYYLNDAGLVVCETTLAQTRFDIKGMTVASRIRQALQYADTIDKACAILEESNNGLYTNEWLLADVKTNEIAMFELGTHKSKLYRSSKNEWVGGTEGFYWGCNNTKDLQVRLETIASVEGRPGHAVFRPSDRDLTWLRLYDEHKGKIDADFGKLAFTTPPLAAYHSVDAKFTTSDMAKRLETWALFGPPLGRTWKPTFEERQRYPEVQPLVGNPWVILHAKEPAHEKGKALLAVDLHNPAGSTLEKSQGSHHDRLATVPAWHGTLLPATDADVWLATAFASYERIVADEKALLRRADFKRTPHERDRLAVALFGHRADYFLGARGHTEMPLEQTHSDVRQNDWYRVAAGKGVLLLHALRDALGEAPFLEMMDAFGRDHAGKAVTTTQFQAHVKKWTDNRNGFFDAWLTQKGLPRFHLGAVTPLTRTKGYAVKVEVRQDGTWPRTAVEVTVETTGNDVTGTVVVEGGVGTAVIETSNAPRRVVLDKYALTPRANGGPFSVLTFDEEPAQALIVYGTGDEANVNQEAAEALQQAIRERHSNITVPIKTDRECTEDDLKTRHLLLLGRPGCNALVARFRDALPIRFGTHSFTVRGEVYAHAGSAVLAAAENPVNPRFSLVVIAGMNAAATLRAAPLLAHSHRPAEVVVLPNGGEMKALVVPAKELVREVEEGAPSKSAQRSP